jgi:hypothetical protein
MVGGVGPIRVNALPMSLTSEIEATFRVLVPTFLIWTLNVRTSGTAASPSAEPRFVADPKVVDVPHEPPAQSISGTFGRLVPVTVLDEDVIGGPTVLVPVIVIVALCMTGVVVAGRRMKVTLKVSELPADTVPLAGATVNRLLSLEVMEVATDSPASPV